MSQPRLAKTLEQLASDGLDSFYRGPLAERIAADFQRVGSPLAAEDLAGFATASMSPLRLQLPSGTIYNLPPPTQGLASLLIVGVFEQLQVPAAESFLTAEVLSQYAAAIDPKQALPWTKPSVPGDTVWIGVIDSEGCAVSMLQSLYQDFGSAVVLPQTGVLWQNRGTSFSLDPAALNYLEPGRKPFHTLNPALAELPDGRLMVYGTMGGEGQPQTLAAIYSRYAIFGRDLQESVSAPRWLLDMASGAGADHLYVENRFAPDLLSDLEQAGHCVEPVDSYSDWMGHAGALVRHGDGTIDAASDPRNESDVQGW